MKSTLKKMDIDTIFSILEEIESTTALKIEDFGLIRRLTINKDILDGDEEKRRGLRKSYLLRVICLMESESKFFNYLKEKNISINEYMEHYSNLYTPYISPKKINKYKEQILGEDYKKACINLEIKEGSVNRPIILFIFHRSDYELIKKMYSEEEVLKLIDLKKIVVSSNPVYKEYEEKDKLFFCGIEDCTDLDDERVIEFTLKHYPFIYEELRNSISDSKIDKDKIKFLKNRRNGLKEILYFYDLLRLRHMEKANEIGEIEDICMKKMYMLNTTSKKHNNN